MSDYTPTTEEVRAAASRAIGGDWFDRWLAAHDAEVRAAETDRCAQIAESLDFGPAPEFSRPAAHAWGARQAAKRIREKKPDTPSGPFGPLTIQALRGGEPSDAQARGVVVSVFSSRPPFNDDPEPWRVALGPWRGVRTEAQTPESEYAPRPEFTRIPHNPTNPILAEFRENVAEDSRNGMPLSESIEDMVIMCNPVFWGRDEANEEHIEHALRVLKRLARLAEV